MLEKEISRNSLLLKVIIRRIRFWLVFGLLVALVRAPLSAAVKFGQDFDDGNASLWIYSDSAYNEQYYNLSLLILNIHVLILEKSAYLSCYINSVRLANYILFISQRF